MFFRGYWAESGGSDKPGFKELVASLMFKRDLGARKALAGAEAPHAAWGLCFMVWMEKKDRLGQPVFESRHRCVVFPGHSGPPDTDPGSFEETLTLNAFFHVFVFMGALWG